MITRMAVIDDAEAIARIYNQAIEDGGANFETRPRSTDEVRGWFGGRHPLVAVEGGGLVIAFAASSAWRQHERYAGIGEVAVYVAREHRGQGAGRAALEALSLAAERAGLWKLLAGTIGTNTASRNLLRAAGYREVGVYERQTRHQGKWIDVVMFEKLIPELVVFACLHNAGRSQMAAAFFNLLADPGKARALSAGTQPAERLHPEVMAAMREAGAEMTSATPQKLTADLARGAALLVTMGCGDECPAVHGVARDDWPLPDPKGQPAERVREIRDEIQERVARLVQAKDWSRR